MVAWAARSVPVTMSRGPLACTSSGAQAPEHAGQRGTQRGDSRGGLGAAGRKLHSPNGTLQHRHGAYPVERNGP